MYKKGDQKHNCQENFLQERLPKNGTGSTLFPVAGILVALCELLLILLCFLFLRNELCLLSNYK
jgi:hypothetical protein